MRILFSTYPAAFDCPGGGEVMLLKSQEALERAGAEVIRFNRNRSCLIQATVTARFWVASRPCSFVRQGLEMARHSRSMCWASHPGSFSTLG